MDQRRIDGQEERKPRPSERERLSAQQKREQRRRQVLIMRAIVALLALFVLLLLVLVIRGIASRVSTGGKSAKTTVEGQAKPGDANDKAFYETEKETDSADSLLFEASLLASMYDYDSAITVLKDSAYYAENEDMQKNVIDYQSAEASCIAWDPENVTHIFFHSIIVDPDRAFDGDAYESGYNQYMVTMDEFSKIINTMYDEGYVMVSMHDMCSKNSDGSLTEKTIQLPEGKIPFVLSQDDVSYYHYMDGDGFAQKLIVDENGEVKNTYIDADGNLLVGDYDLVPWIDSFVKEHPDFSYHGHKGILALTGYEGVLGYRTDEVYRTREESRLTEWQIQFFEANPDFDEEAWQQEVDEATKVANAMKENGWEFASHTWGHIDPQAKGIDSVKLDTERWLDNVAPIVGDTDVIIFAFGADIGDWQPYSSDNALYSYLKEKGFDIYCNVDSSTYWVQFNGESMRMARRNIDGYRMYYNPDLLTDLFTVSDVWDEKRPDTVPAI